MTVRFGVISGCFAVSTGMAFGQYTPYFTSLGALPNATYSSVGYALSNNGATVVGYTGSSVPNSIEAFKWTQATGMTSIYPNETNIYNTKAHGVSADGLTIMGECDATGGGRAFRWTQSGGLTTIGDLAGGGSFSAGYGISSDGNTIVGYSESGSGNEAFRWTQGGGMVGLGDLPGGGFQSKARAVSGNGSVVVGTSDTTDGSFTAGQAFRWTSATGMTSLGTLPGGPIGSDAFGISEDGNTIVGLAKVTSNQFRPYKWTAATGMVQIGGEAGQANAVSQNGAVVVGSMSNGSFSEAFLYDDVNGFRWLKQTLISRGLGSQLSGWTLTSATGVTVTDFGVPVITGWGIDPNGKNRAFVAAVPEPASLVGLLGGTLILIRCRRKRNP